MKIIFGGSFDPIHNGHIAMMQYLYQKCFATKTAQTNKILFLPNNGNPNYKAPHCFSSLDRINMIQLIMNKFPDQFELCDLELQSQQYMSTIVSIKKLHEMYPKEMLYFVIGYDSLLSLDTWDNWQNLCGLVNFIVFSRGSVNPSIPKKLEPYLTKFNLDDIAAITNYGKVAFAEMDNIDISSTDIRKLIKNKQESWQQMVAPEIADYINRKVE